MYIQMALDGTVLYSFPPAMNLPDFWSDFIDGYRNGDVTHWPVYRTAIRPRISDTYFHLTGKDLEYDSTEVLVAARTMVHDRALFGVIFWEIPLQEIFK